MKNKYERLFDRILDNTRNKSIKWKLLNRNTYSDIIFNANLVFRLFEGELVVDDDSNYKLLFVEKKFSDPEFDYRDHHQTEILVLDRQEIVTTLNDSVIERTDLYQLLTLIEENSDKANKLFDKV